MADDACFAPHRRSVLALEAISNTALANVRELQRQHGMEPLAAGSDDELSANEVVLLGERWSSSWWAAGQNE